MAAYRMHVTTAGLLGVTAVAAAWIWAPDSITLQASALAVLAAWIGGMVPDIDHDTGTALVECSGLLATCIPAMGAVFWAGEIDTIGASGWFVVLPAHYALHAALRKIPFFHDRTGFFGFLRNIVVAALCSAGVVAVLSDTGWTQNEMSHVWWVMVATSLSVVCSIPLFTRITVHRGVWHTIPTIAAYALILYLLARSFTWEDRLLIAAGATLGGLSHLLLDELYSVDFDGVVPRIKPSMGSAMSLWKKNAPIWSIAIYLLVGALTLTALNEPTPPSKTTPDTTLEATP